MSEPNDLKPAQSADSTNSTTPLQKDSTKNNNDNNDTKDDDKNNNKYIHAPHQHSLQDENNYATMIIKQTDLENIAIEMESTTKTQEEQNENEVEEEEEKKDVPINSPSIKNIQTKSKSKSDNTTNKTNGVENRFSRIENRTTEDDYSHSLSGKTRESVESITQRTDFSNKGGPKSPNPLDTTKLTHDANDVEIGGDKNSPVIAPYHHNTRMPSISYNNVDKELAALRRASRRKWWSPTRLCDWCMHKLIFGKVMVMILTWTTVIDYGKDLYVAYHFGQLGKWWEFSVTLCILFLSLRLMLYLRAIDDASISFWKLLIFYLPGSVYADFQIDRFSDVGVCLFWEIAILLGTPFVPFFLIYLAMRKSISLFCQNKKGQKRSFENPYLLSYAVVECIFETTPQLCLQTYLYFHFYHSDLTKTQDRKEVSEIVFIIAWIISILVLIKIPIVVWYNWRIVYKLSFKRRHAGEIISIKYHPIQDIIATGSWDHTVLINSIISKGTENGTENEIKAKRVLDHHYNINCIAFHKTSFDIIAVAGQGVELFNWRIGKSIATFPKTKERDQLRRKKRHRTKEVKEVIFSPDGKRLIWCQGKNVLVYDIENQSSLKKGKELLKIKCIQGNRLGDVQCVDISPNGKYIACGLYQNQIKVYNSYNKDLIRVLEGHTSAVTCVKFDRYGKYIISGGADCKVLVFDFRLGEKIKSFNQHTSDVMCIAIDYTNRFIASAGRDKTLYITYLDDKLNNKELRPLKKWVPYKTHRDIRCCDFSPYGDTVACAAEDHQVYILTLPMECHTRNTNRFSMDIKKELLDKINDNEFQQQHEQQQQMSQQPNKHTLQYSNIEAITTNDYNKFDPKEHNIF